MTAFQVGSLPVYVYGGLVALAALAALFLMIYTGKKQGLSEGTVSWFAVLAVPLVFLMARAGYCLANIKWVMERGLGFFFRFTSGGYLLYGGMAYGEDCKAALQTGIGCGGGSGGVIDCGWTLSGDHHWSWLWLLH